MGSALLDGWLESGTAPDTVTIIEPGPTPKVAAGVTVITDLSELAIEATANIVVFAVKPQVMDQVVPAYSRFTGPDTVFLSIAAGKTIGFFENLLGDQAAGEGPSIVRAMPNTPAAVGRGISVCVGNSAVTDQQMNACRELLSAVGEVAVIDDEAQMDAVTAVSGSGPAYVFLLTECLARAGVEAGLPSDLAAELARATVSGSGGLLDAADDSPETLRQNVTSPGGTTAAALEVLMADDAMPAILRDAIAAATRRSRELAG